MKHLTPKKKDVMNVAMKHLTPKDICPHCLIISVNFINIIS
jgi:hypothetical protein